MYYRVFIAFEGGSYLISKPVRPTKDTANYNQTAIRYPWQTDPNSDPSIQIPPSPSIPGETKQAAWAPSKTIFTSRDNNVVIHLPNVDSKKYIVKFFNESNQKLFELTNLNDNYLIVEKVNFKRSGWYYFEVFENGHQIEKNKFFIAKDGKITNDTPKKTGNR